MKFTTEPIANSYQKERLLTNLHHIFGDFDTSMLTILEPLLDWVEVGGGETLFRQNDPGDSLYFVISGRLQASVITTDGRQQIIGEIVRGETVGEMAIFTGDPRSATIVALRDSLLVMLSKEAFEQVIAAYPAVSMNVTKLIINRLRQTQSPKLAPKKPVNICLMALHDHLGGPSAIEFAQSLTGLLAQKGAVYVASSAGINAHHNRADLAQTTTSDPGGYRQLSQWLDDLELQHEFMLYVTDPVVPGEPPSEWTLRCLRQGDEILLLASVDQGPGLTAIEEQYLVSSSPTRAVRTLVLLHPATAVMPRHTAQWLALRPFVNAHYHLRTGLHRDMARLSRILSGTAIGLVLAGGGAKGFAHIGVFRALRERAIPIDVLGGTSVGGLIAASISFDQPVDITTRYLRKAALSNPTKDYNLFPFISLIRGRRMEQMIETCIQDFTGHTDTHLEDSWLTFFTLSSNYTQAREEIHTRGLLSKYLRATSAIPGVFPPVIDGNDLLIDGGTFNNFPADVMNRFGVGRVIGVDLRIDKPRQLTVDRIPSPNALMRDRFRPKSLKKYRLPSLMSIMLNTTLLHSSARRNETIHFTDLYFNPDVSRYGLMSWASFDQIVAKGYEHAQELLEQLSDEKLNTFRF